MNTGTRHCSVLTFCVHLWIPPGPPQREVFPGWSQAPPWRVRRNLPRSSSESAPWPPKGTRTLLTATQIAVHVCSCLCVGSATHWFFKCGKELNVRMELLCGFVKCFKILKKKKKSVNLGSTKQCGTKQLTEWSRFFCSFLQTDHSNNQILQ